MLNYRVLIFGAGCFRSWVALIVLLPWFPTPMVIVLAFFIVPPVYIVAALEEWVFRLIVEHNQMKRVPIEKTLDSLVLASLLAPIVLSGLVFLPFAMIAPLEGIGQAFVSVGVAAGGITVASFLVMMVRKHAIVDDLLYL